MLDRANVLGCQVLHSVHSDAFVFASSGQGRAICTEGQPVHIVIVALHHCTLLSFTLKTTAIHAEESIKSLAAASYQWSPLR